MWGAVHFPSLALPWERGNGRPQPLQVVIHGLFGKPDVCSLEFLMQGLVSELWPVGWQGGEKGAARGMNCAPLWGVVQNTGFSRCAAPPPQWGLAL